MKLCGAGLCCAGNDHIINTNMFGQREHESNNVGNVVGVEWSVAFIYLIGGGFIVFETHQ